KLFLFNNPGFIETWQKSLLVAVLPMKNTFKQVFQVILRVYPFNLQPFYQREGECRVFLPHPHCQTFIQFLSSSFTGFILLLTEVVRDFC
ncbi:hypothetical protein BACOVA_00008, partial [Bacteroides ovatus ATCC 8483]